MGKKSLKKQKAVGEETATKILNGFSTTVSPMKTLLPSEEISNAIVSLLETIPNSFEMPPYRSEEDTIYLQFATNHVDTRGVAGRVILPNPLSYNRSVCVIASKTGTNETIIPTLEGIIKEIGITGKISVIPVEKVKESIDANDGLPNKFAKSANMFIADEKALKSIGSQALFIKLTRLCKHINVFRTRKFEDIKRAIDISPISPNSTNDGYLWRIGHRAMSVSEILENVTAALRVLSMWTRTLPEGLAHFSAVRLGNGAGAAVDLYVNPGEVVPCKEDTRSMPSEKYPKADVQLYWKNRIQEEDGTAYWKMGEKKMSEILQGKTEVITDKPAVKRKERPKASKKATNATLTPEEVLARRVERKQKKKRTQLLRRQLAKAGIIVKANADFSVAAENPDHPVPAKKRKMAPHVANSTATSLANGLTRAEDLGAEKKHKKRKSKALTPAQATENSSVQAEAQQTVATPGSPLVPVGTPGSGKKRKLPHNNTPVTDGSPVPAKQRITAPNTPLKAETPGSVAVQGSVNDSTPAGTPGSAKKRRRSRNKGTPATGTPDQAKNTPLKSATPLKAETPLKVDTPLKIATPGSASVLTSVNDGTPAGTPGSAKKRRRSQSKGTPNIGTPNQAKENTPLKADTPLNTKTPVKIATPGSAAVMSPANSGTPAGTPGSAKKRRRSRNKGTPATGTTDQTKENTPLKTATPLKVETPVSMQKTPFKENTPLVAKPITPGPTKVAVLGDGVSPVVTPGSGKKRRRSRKNGTPVTVGTPGPAKENTPLKVATPIVAQPMTPVLLAATPGKVITPGSGGKKRRTRQSLLPKTPSVAVGTPGNANTPGSGGKKRRTRQSLLPTTPAVLASTPGNVNTPDSGSKKRRTRRSVLPGTPGVATPGADGKKSPGMKMRLRQRPSMGIGKN